MQTSFGHAHLRLARSYLLSVHGLRCLAQTAFLVIGIVFLIARVDRKTEWQQSVGAHRRFFWPRHPRASIGTVRRLACPTSSAAAHRSGPDICEQSMAALFPTC
jgi:hypothetical protein